MKNFIKNNSKILVISFIVIVLFITLAKIYSYTQVEKAKTEMWVAHQEQLQEAQKLSPIEVIEQDITFSKLDQEAYNQVLWKAEIELQEAQDNLDKATKLRNSNVWYTRCKEIQGELLLKHIENNLVCVRYSNWPYQQEPNEEAYSELEKFASYNLNQTKIDLGL